MKSNRLFAIIITCLVLAGCSKESYNSPTGPGPIDNPPPTNPNEYRLKAYAPAAHQRPGTAADGDSVFGQGSLFSPNWDELVYVGTFQNGQINSTFEKVIPAHGETYDLVLWAKYGTELHRMILGYNINGQVLTDLGSDKFGIRHYIKPVRGENGIVIPNAEDDLPKLMDVDVVYTGVSPGLPPELAYLNQPADVNDPAFTSSTWSGLRPHFGNWDGAAWNRPITVVKGDTCLVRLDGIDRQKLPGCYLRNNQNGQMLEMVHLIDIDSDPDPSRFWGYFAVIVHPDGTMENAGPDNRWDRIILGQPLGRPYAVQKGIDLTVKARGLRSERYHTLADNR